MSGQLNNVRTDVMSGSQSVTIKLLTGINMYAFFSCICVLRVHMPAVVKHKQGMVSHAL